MGDKGENMMMADTEEMMMLEEEEKEGRGKDNDVKRWEQKTDT